MTRRRMPGHLTPHASQDRSVGDDIARRERREIDDEVLKLIRSLINRKTRERK